jgi:hypothetical protein
MKRAFRNEYEPIISDFSLSSKKCDKPKEKIKELEPIDPEHEEIWLKMRKYEYYQRHKASVDKYGIVEPDMTLSSEEVKELRIYLEQKHNERMAQIEQYKQEITEEKGMRRILQFPWKII